MSTPKSPEVVPDNGRVHSRGERGRAYGLGRLRTLGQMARDVRFGVRALTRTPGFTLGVLGVLGLGIGLNVTGFGSLNALLLRPLPYPDPQQLVGLDETAKGSSRGCSVSLANFFDWHERQRVFDALAAFHSASVTLTDVGEAENVKALVATAELFTVLGVAPAAGRTFVAGDTQPGATPVVVLSDHFWRRRFNAAPILGSTIRLDGVPTTVIGIMPPGFSFPLFRTHRTQVYYPMRVERALLNRANHSVWGIARLQPGRSLRQARAEMQVIGDQLAREHPGLNPAVEPLVVSLRDLFTDKEIRLATVLIAAAAGFVLLIGCSNVVNLLLARGSVRSREMALRAALGASRGQLTRQLLAESLVLTAGGTAVGLLLGGLGLKAIAATLTPDELIDLGLGIDVTVLAFAVLVMLVTTVVVGLLPALRASKPNLREDLHESGGPTTARRVGRTQRTLVVVEMAVALVLLVCTGLMTRALLTLLLTKPGFDATQVAVMDVSPPGSAYPTVQSLRLFYANLLDAVGRLPGVSGAAAGTRLPTQPASWVPSIITESTAAPSPAGRFAANAVVVTPGYFESLGIKLLQGRTFMAGDDRPDTPPAVVVNRTFVELHWPNADPIGRRLKLWFSPTNNSDWFTVVGVVDDVLNAANNAPITTYFAFEQLPARSMTLIVKGSADPMALVPAVRGELARVDPDVPLSDIRTMGALVDDFLWRPRLLATVFAVAGVLALLLAAVGVYGVLAYSVSRRTREIGIRATLGAKRSYLIRLVLYQGLRPALEGIGIGLGLSFVASRALRSLLLGVSPIDPLAYVVMTGVLLTAALLACYLPARRACGLDPLLALRHE